MFSFYPTLDSTVLVELGNEEKKERRVPGNFSFKYRLTGRSSSCFALFFSSFMAAQQNKYFCRSLCLPFVQLLGCFFLHSREKEFIACIKMFLISASHIRVYIAERREGMEGRIMLKCSAMCDGDQWEPGQVGTFGVEQFYTLLTIVMVHTSKHAIYIRIVFFLDSSFGGFWTLLRFAFLSQRSEVSVEWC